MEERRKRYQHSIDKRMRGEFLKQKPFLLWFTGFCGSGKSTLADAVEVKLFEKGYHTYFLDGDNVRTGLNKDLGFDDTSRTENIRRIGELCNLFLDAGLIVLSAFISPSIKDRQNVRDLLEEKEFIEVFVDTPISVCEERDIKGLYKRAQAGEIENFTGISSEYEEPINPEIHIKNYDISVDEASNIIIEYLQKHGYI